METTILGYIGITTAFCRTYFAGLVQDALYAMPIVAALSTAETILREGSIQQYSQLQQYAFLLVTTVLSMCS